VADKLALLRQLNLFDEMSEAEIAEVSRHLRMCEVGASSPIGGEA
jgi:hypothetical protein